MTDVTRLLVKLKEGDSAAAEELLPLVYDELHRLAERKLRNERSDHTLQATALVHEAYIRLIDSDGTQKWENRKHFLGAAAKAMKRILIECARNKLAEKRGGGLQRVAINADEFADERRSTDLMELDLVLKELEELDSQKAQLVNLRYFGGLTLEEAACVLGISRATASRYWAFTKAWLFDRLKREGID